MILRLLLRLFLRCGRGPRIVTMEFPEICLIRFFAFLFMWNVLYLIEQDGRKSVYGW